MKSRHRDIRALSGFRSPKIRIILIIAIMIMVLVVAVVYLAGIGPFQSSTNTTFTTSLYYHMTVNYSGSWHLVYWGQNGTYDPREPAIPWTNDPYLHYNVMGNLNGSGYLETTIGVYVVGRGQNTLCANVTELSTQPKSPVLTLTLDPGQSRSTTDNTVQVCGSMGV